jgi:UDP-3-O-[3-hydroxymyristoyl] glucosamine N-acyltransferase
MKLPKELSLAEIAHLVNGKVQGSPATKVSAVALDPFKAKDGELAIVFDPKLIRRLGECTATALVVPEGVKTDLPRVEVVRPLLALTKMLAAVAPKRFLPAAGIHPTAIVDPSCEIGENVAIGPYVVIGPHTKIGNNTVVMASCVIGGAVEIGQNCLLYPSCLIADYIRIGNRVILQQGASLGSDGFGYVTERPSNLELKMTGSKDFSDDPNPLLKIPQIGTIIVEDDAEIGSYTTIDRATMGATIIGQGSKIDNQVMIAHNTRIGREAIVVAHASIAGSCVIGDRAVLAGHCAVKDHIKIGKDAIVEGASGAMRDVPDNGVVAGTPAIPAREYFTILAHERKLPELSSELKELKKKVAQLEALLSERRLVAQGEHAGN